MNEQRHTLLVVRIGALIVGALAGYLIAKYLAERRLKDMNGMVAAQQKVITELVDKTERLEQQLADPDTLFDAKFTLGQRALYSLRNYDAVVDWFTACIEMRRDDERCYINRGNACEKKRQWQVALDDYDKALELNVERQSVGGTQQRGPDFRRLPRG